MKKIVAIIPARYEASRFPGKLLMDLHGKSIIRRTYEAVRDTQLFDEVIVACDDERIEKEILAINGKCFRSKMNHESGSDRIAELAKDLEVDIVVNVQGDEPFIDKAALQKVIRLFDHPNVEVASLMMPISEEAQIQNPNCVKVVVDKMGRALYFSRAAIPFKRDLNSVVNTYKHIGIYAFTKQALLQFTQWEPTILEQTEKLENLRMLENGLSIYLDIVDHVGISIDTPADYQAAKEWLAEQ